MRSFHQKLKESAMQIAQSLRQLHTGRRDPMHQVNAGRTLFGRRDTCGYLTIMSQILWSELPTIRCRGCLTVSRRPSGPLYDNPTFAPLSETAKLGGFKFGPC